MVGGKDDDADADADADTAAVADAGAGKPRRTCRRREPFRWPSAPSSYCRSNRVWSQVGGLRGDRGRWPPIHSNQCSISVKKVLSVFEARCNPRCKPNNKPRSAAERLQPPSKFTIDPRLLTAVIAAGVAIGSEGDNDTAGPSSIC